MSRNRLDQGAGAAMIVGGATVGTLWLRRLCRRLSFGFIGFVVAMAVAGGTVWSVSSSASALAVHTTHAHVDCECGGGASSSFPDPPVIGIFSQPLSSSFSNHHHHPKQQQQKQEEGEENDYYIAASYIKWLEGGGARTIAIPYDANMDEHEPLLDDLLAQIQLLFLPGGEAELSPAMIYLLDKIHQQNQHNAAATTNTTTTTTTTTTAGCCCCCSVGFPLWGTCLGMEFLLSHFGQDDAPLRERFDAENMSLPLHHVVRSNRSTNTTHPQDLHCSMMRHTMMYDDPHVYNIVTTQPVTMNNHRVGMSPSVFAGNAALTDLWQITSINEDRQHQPFVSTFEPVHPLAFPYYGVQYHPEKNAYEYGMVPVGDHNNDTTNNIKTSPSSSILYIPYEAINHSPSAIEFSSAMARYVVQLARRRQQHPQCGCTCVACTCSGSNATHNNNKYTNPQRYPPVYTYPIRTGVAFEQIYIIPSAAEMWPNHTNATTATKTSTSQPQQELPVEQQQARHRHRYEGLAERIAVMQW